MAEHGRENGTFIYIADSAPINKSQFTGFIHDMDNASEIVSIEASRRIGDNIKISLESGLFINPSPDDLLYDLRDDGFLRLEAAYYF